MTMPAGANPAAHAAFRAARDFLLQTADPVQAHAGFVWPELHQFNWARDWFEVVAAEHGERTALLICAPDAEFSATFAELSQRSDQVAAWLQGLGLQRGERVLVLLRNSIALYEVLLASIKLGLVVIPSYVSISANECADRVQRGGIRHVIAEQALTERLADLPPVQSRIVVHGEAAGWIPFAASQQAGHSYQAPDTLADELLFAYFTSGTTSLPKLALHTHVSYPVGHLSGMYWNGVRPGGVHLNVSNPGWAKHAWSSFFVPWNAEATVVALDAAEIRPEFILDVLRRHQVSSCCAPTTVWRMLQHHGMGERPPALQQLNSAGEPLQPVLFDAVKAAWGLEIRDGYGQSEATALVGNAPALPIKVGSMGLPLPGYQVVLLDGEGRVVEGADVEGEVCLDLRAGKPCGLMHGYDENTTSKRGVVEGDFYHTGDFAKRDADGYITFIGRIDDVFKSFDYRISPFELERVLLAHPAIVELAIVPSPDPLGLVVPKAFICTHQDWYPGEETALDIARWMRDHLPPEFRIRRISFVSSLPKTASGKVRRAELRDREGKRSMPISALEDEFLVDELLQQE